MKKSLGIGSGTVLMCFCPQYSGAGEWYWFTNSIRFPRLSSSEFCRRYGDISKMFLV